jgi:hypothetical protein
VLQLLDVGADDPSRLDALQAQLPVDLLNEVVAQPGHLAAQLRDLIAQYALHLATEHHRDLLIRFGAPSESALALGEHRLGLVGLAAPWPERRERTKQSAPQADEQADLNLLLGMPDDDEVNGDAAQGDRQQHAQCAQCPSWTGTRYDGGHVQSLARRSGRTVSASLRFVSG